ncbi:TPA: hypothetical protein ACHQNL_001372 [Serratia marcescens]|uniref:hypothetical protein n=1 Tax=Serratia marcescens TaxID=615 RepID=UPI00112BE430|nr:hypothetical protein [Serratia marcescens]MBN5432045.1 hypothetical protein [Serratia marcescens]MDS0779139.1 hypothetical protein [Serratia marcescens]TPV65361.1 hypothetical protein FJ699_18220 [Serratia marcescens]BEO08436.1 hypothetical protein SMQC15_13480 [Serratia marcescens]
MKERPVIFNSEMVRAIIDGRKTQTRRVIANVSPDNCIPLQKPTKTKDGIYTHVMDAPGHGLCPFGRVGDRLWVRETFAGHYLDDDQIQDIKDGRCKAKDLCEYRSDYGDDADCADGWAPSIHMPRWASRILLEITAVRVERLNDISEEDARAEGAPTELCIIGEKHYMGFRTLWKSIYGEENWRANPWVWVIEFRRVEVK